MKAKRINPAGLATMGADSDIASTHVGPSAAASRLEVDVVADGADWTILEGLDAGTVVAEVAIAMAAHMTFPAPRCTATVALSDDDEVQALNKAWRGQDKPTNVLSFPSPVQSLAPGPAAGATPGRETERFLGDVILAEATLAREAAGMGIAAADHFRHLVLHGLLHLLGFDHETEPEAARMEALEALILAGLGVADPYAEPAVGTGPTDQSDAAGDSAPSGAERE